MGNSRTKQFISLNCIPFCLAWEMLLVEGGPFSPRSSGVISARHHPTHFSYTRHHQAACTTYFLIMSGVYFWPLSLGRQFLKGGVLSGFAHGRVPSFWNTVKSSTEIWCMKEGLSSKTASSLLFSKSGTMIIATMPCVF